MRPDFTSNGWTTAPGPPGPWFYPQADGHSSGTTKDLQLAVSQSSELISVPAPDMEPLGLQPENLRPDSAHQWTGSSARTCPYWWLGASPEPTHQQAKQPLRITVAPEPVMSSTQSTHQEIGTRNALGSALVNSRPIAAPGYPGRDTLGGHLLASQVRI